MVSAMPRFFLFVPAAEKTKERVDRMKKKRIRLYAQLLVPLLLIQILLCGTALADDAAGTWSLSRASYAGIEVEASELGIEMVFVLEPAGIGKLYSNIDGVESENVCTWSRKGNIVTIQENASVYEFTFSGNEMIGDIDGVTMVMTREKAAPSLAAKKSFTMADFNGKWECFRLYYRGEEFTMEELESSMWLVLEDGKGTMAVKNDAQITEAKVTANLYENLQYDEQGPVTVLEVVADGDDMDVVTLIPYEDNILLWKKDDRGAIFVLERQNATMNTIVNVIGE